MSIIPNIDSPITTRVVSEKEMSKDFMSKVRKDLNRKYKIKKWHIYSCSINEEWFISRFELYSNKHNQFYEPIIIHNWIYKSVSDKIQKDLNISENMFINEMLSFTTVPRWYIWPEEWSIWNIDFVLRDWIYKKIT